MRLAWSLAFVTPCLFAACGDPDGSSVQSGDREQPDAGPDGGGSREIVASLAVTSPSCVRPVVAGYDITARYADDNAEVPNLRCRIEFENGATVDRCSGEYVTVFGNQPFIVDIEDLDTGATAHLEERAFVYPVMEIDFDFETPSCGLSFDFHVSVPQSTSKRFLLSPADNIVGYDGGDWLGGTHVDVTAAGQYRVDAFLEQERTNGPTCSFHVFRDISARECDHEHPPTARIGRERLREALEVHFGISSAGIASGSDGTLPVPDGEFAMSS